jgi:hypothetical protein
VKRSGRALIGILAAMAILVALVVVFAVGPKAVGQDDGKSPQRADGKGETIVGKAVYAAKDDVCRQQLGQVRQGIQIATDPVEGTYPTTLAETRLGTTITSCPIGKVPYQYDSATGVAKCPHPGHEKY